MRFGLIGEKLGHSYSKTIHEMLGLYGYELLPTAPEDLAAVLSDVSYGGFNVTIPYKRAVLPYCAELEDEARAIGCVNTLLRGADGGFIGYNTDLFGFLSMLDFWGIDVCGKKVAVLGSGGTSMTAQEACRQRSAREVIVVSRSHKVCYEDAEVIINTTPVGMFPDVDSSPIDLRKLPRLEAVVDVIYNPLRTRLVQQAEDLGVKSVGGFFMLVSQAVRAAELFTGRQLRGEIARIYSALKAQTENIALIGMPGCGKTAVGNALAALTGRELLDTDAIIEERVKKSIPQIFAEDGEATFRALECKSVAECGTRTGVIISTGGGAIISFENRAALKQNSRVFWLERDVLATEGRPLSKDAETLRRMAIEREPFYVACADVKIKNNAAPEGAAREIIHMGAQLALAKE